MGKKTTKLGAATKAVDPTLAALFTGSAGPVKAPPRSRYSALLESGQNSAKDDRKSHVNGGGEESEDIGDDEELSEASEELDYEEGDVDGQDEESNEEEESSSSETQESKQPKESQASADKDNDVAMDDDQTTRGCKRKRKDAYEDLEDKYLAKLSAADGVEPAEKRRKSAALKESDAEDADDAADVPQHESLTKDTKSSEIEKAKRTVFLANVASDAITSKSAKKTLMNHLSSVLDESAGDKIESIRFRSVAFSAGAMPKKAAFITKQLMEATTKSTNAYVVCSSPSAARKATTKLNGTEVLGRHIRIDSVSHPSPTDHHRCVFVGNLGFVDDESVLNSTEDGETVKKKRNKTPGDVEEGLWRTFGKQGKVENVRVVRDPKTRVGKGFAYVQFYDGNSVESALLLDGQNFPPMLPRKLRVTRAKDPRKTAMALEREKEKLTDAKRDSKSKTYKPKFTPEEKSMAGRAGKLLGRAGAAAERRKRTRREDYRGDSKPKLDGLENIKTPQEVVFEGTRASAKNGRPKDLKLGKKSEVKGGKPKNRSARRGSEWKKKT